MAAPVGEGEGGYREYDPGRALHVLHARAGGVDLDGGQGEIRQAHHTRTQVLRSVR